MVWPAVLLAWIAGFIDALGYLALAQVFTSHMTGNAAAAGVHLAQAGWRQAALRGLAIPAFLVGVCIGALSERLASRWRWRMRLTPAFIFEIALLAGFKTFFPRHSAVHPGSLHFFALVWLLAAAMGVQSSTLRRAGGRRVQTTFVSGMLMRTGEEFVAWLLRRPSRRGRAPSGKPRPPQRHGRNALLFGAIFLSFTAGAIMGGSGEENFGVSALLIPAVGLLVVIGEDVVHSGSPSRDGSVGPA